MGAQARQQSAARPEKKNGHKRSPRSTETIRSGHGRSVEKLLALDGPTMWEKNEGHATAVARISQIPGCDQRPLETISAATIDRLLGDFKIQSGKKARPPKPASGVKSLVEIRAENWDTAQPGWTEVDTVAHCGGDMGGSFIWTLTSVDVSSGWTELRAIWNRSQHACFEGLESIHKSQPFKLLGVDSDNGGEFLNYHVYNWLKDHGIRQTRSRPYFKNDQAYVEQKNYTHVRGLLGYDRLEHPELLSELNELLSLWSLWKNLYCVTMKQASCRREGSRQVRRHEKKNRTPAQRLLDSGQLSKEHEKQIKDHLSALNPFEMKAQIQQKEDALWLTRAELMEQEGVLIMRQQE